MYYIVYKTTNTVNCNFYVGIHKTASLEEFDGYLGSGKVLKSAIKLYGKESFVRETLFVYTDLESAYQKERDIVNEAFIRSDNTYNIQIGGSGGTTISGYSQEELQLYKMKLSKAQTDRYIENRKKFDGYSVQPKDREIMSNSAKLRVKQYPNSIPDNKGRVFSERGLENIRSAGAKRKGRYCNINDGNTTMSHDKQIPIPVGFVLGNGPDKPINVKGPRSEETKRKIRETKRLKSGKRYTNGTINRTIFVGELVPEGFYPGMTLSKESSFWITNGTDNKRINVGDQIPPTFFKGRTMKRKNDAE